MIQRTIIGGKIYDKTKNEASEAPLPLDDELIRLLLDWHAKSEFNKDSDWVWASPWSAGEMPLYFNAIQRDYIVPASLAVGLGKIEWHTFRHYAEYRNMPHRVWSKRDQRLKTGLTHFRYSTPMRHSPVWFTESSGSQATHCRVGRIVACFL